MSAKKARAVRYRSRLSAAIHETAAGLHRIGLMDKATMREFDASCLTAIEPLQPAIIEAKKKREDAQRSPAFGREPRTHASCIDAPRLWGIQGRPRRVN